jgi:di/tricarboxylate transporter
MPFQLYYTVFLIIVMSLILVKGWISTELTIFSVLLLLIFGKVVNINEAFVGFSNAGVISIGLLFVVAGGIRNSGALNQLNGIIFGKKRESITGKLFRMLFSISAISAFVNNTPVVALFIPSVRSMAEKQDYAISKFLIPLSYAAILGGMCTLIGTTTNLIVHGLLLQNGYAGFSFFEITWIGLPSAVIGLLFIIFFGHRLLPERKDPIVELGERTREFVIELRVTPRYENIGKTIEEAGLRHLKGLFLFQIERNGKVIAPAKPTETLKLHDRLFFTGLPQTIIELQKTPGLQLIKDSVFDLKQYDSEEIKPFEAVVSASSPLLGKNVRESKFRETYNAVIIAIHRSGSRLNRKIGDVVLQAGDTLLLLADKGFMNRWYHSNDFYLVSQAAEVPSKPPLKTIISGVVLMGMILLTVFNVLPLVAAAGLAAMILVFTGCISASEAKEKIDWKVLIIIACAFGIANGIQNSGLAEVLADVATAAGLPLGMLGILFSIYMLTSLYTTIITNNAAAAFLFPVALSAAQSLSLDLKPFALTIAIAASASFATPISYQTNLMVYGPGGYRFTDYVKIGLPLQILIGLVAITCIYLLYLR